MSDIERVVAERAIERLLYDYCFYLDMNRPADMAALFVDDCEVSYAPNFGAKGMEAYKKTLEGIGTYFKSTSHHVSNIVIDWVSDREVTVRAIVLAVHRYQEEKPDGILYGQYHDVVVKESGQWKFKKRDLRTTMSTAYHVRKFNPIGRAE